MQLKISLKKKILGFSHKYHSICSSNLKRQFSVFCCFIPVVSVQYLCTFQKCSTGHRSIQGLFFTFSQRSDICAAQVDFI